MCVSDMHVGVSDTCVGVVPTSESISGSHVYPVPVSSARARTGTPSIQDLIAIVS